MSVSLIEVNDMSLKNFNWGQLKLLSVLAINITFMLSLSSSAAAAAINRTMAIDQSGNVYAKDNNPGLWYSQIGAPTTATLIGTGGSRMATVAINGAAQTLVTKNTQISGWSPIETGGVAAKNSVSYGQDSSGGPQLSIGPTGETMIIDPAGNVYAVLDNGSNNWVPESSGGLAIAVAVGGNNSGNVQGTDGRMMMIDWRGTAWSKESLSDTWLPQSNTNGQIAHAVAVGTKGEMMLIDCCGNAYAKLNPTDSWTKETGDNGTKAIAAGGGGRMMVIDSAGNAYSKDGLTSSWVLQVTGAKAIAVGSSGRMVVVDSASRMYYKDNTYDGWTADTLSNYGSPLISYIAIN
ncbi:MAG: hypothetical protein NVS1B7_1430 [Candidatus Saccharimonadales bacterium]